MKKYILPLLCLFIILASCGSKKDKTGLLVPKDAAIVVHVNASSLSSKLSWKEIQASAWFKRAQEKSDDSLGQELMNDPAITGMDMNADFVCFLKAVKKGGYTVFEGKVKDGAQLESFLKKIKNNAVVDKADGISYGYEKGDTKRDMLAWNSSHFMYVHHSPDMSFGGNSQMRRRYSSNEELVYTTNMDSLKLFCKEILNLSSSNVLGVDDRFSSLVTGGGDVHLWVNSTEMYKAGPAAEMMNMMKFSNLLENNISAATLNFDQGKITISSKQYYNKELSSLLKKYDAKPIKASLINRLPADSLMGVIAINYPPAGLKELIKMLGFDGLANVYLAEAGLTLDDIVNANKGEMLIAVTGITKKPGTVIETEGYPTLETKEKPDVKFLFANAVNNKGAFNKLFQTIIGGDEEMLRMKMPDLTYKVEGDWFVAGNSQAHVSTFLADKNNKVSFADRISGKPVAVYIDVQKILTTFHEPAVTGTEPTMMGLSLKTWQDIIITGGEYKNDALEFTAEINMVNKNENSLKQLNSYLDNIVNTMPRRYFDFGNDKFEMPDSADWKMLDTLKKKGF